MKGVDSNAELIKVSKRLFKINLKWRAVKMFKRIKKLLALSLVLVLSLSLSVSVYAVAPAASEKNDVISFEEYYKAVKAEYAKYHIDYECNNYDKSFVFTKKLLNQTLNDIKKHVSAFKYDTSINSFISYANVPQSIVEKKTNVESKVSPDSAFINKNHFIYTTVKSPSGMGQAGIQIRINTTEELQGSKFISINSCISRQYGAALNFDSWQDNGNDLDISSNRTWISGCVYGTLVVGYTEPNTGIHATYSSDHVIAIGITTND